jgi:cell division protein FtsB
MITKLTVPPQEPCCKGCIEYGVVHRLEAELAALRAEVARQANVLDNCAQEYAEEQIRMASIISDMSNEARELRAEVKRLRDGLMFIRTMVEKNDSYAATQIDSILGAGKADA